VGLSISKPLNTLGLIVLGIVWVSDGNIISKFKAFYQNKTALIISSIYFITVLGLFHTSNFDFAFDDLRRKLPLFLFPFFLSGMSPLTQKELYAILKIYIAGVITATLWSLFIYFGGLNINIIDKRDLSRFNSHIRFGLEVALAIFFALYFLYKTNNNINRGLWGLTICWLVLSLFIFSLFSGVVVLVATTIILLFVFGITHSNLKLRRSFFVIFIGVSFGGTWFLYSSVKDFYVNSSEKLIQEIPYSKKGYGYQKDSYTDRSTLKENGYFVEKHVAWVELEKAWNSRSEVGFDGKDKKEQLLKNTLIRFISSKGQRKDSEAIDNLTEKEIRAIEKGVSNYRYLEMNLISVRIHKILWEYETFLSSGNINGHSVLMRWEYWKTSLSIIKKNWLIGVGTGDVQDAFNLQYEKDNSVLIQKYRRRNHNQYLAYGVAFGIVGVIWFLTCLFYPFFKTKGYKNYLYLAFFSVITTSMLVEDTLEVQAGIVFFVFFNAILLLSNKKL
jgi:O-Antigen ligase